MHSCDNPPCCNPKHLKAGSHMENMRDAIEKRRFVFPPSGSNSFKAKLTESLVSQAREEFSTRIPPPRVVELARKYGVDEAAMSAALNGNTWKHVETTITRKPRRGKLTDADIEFIRRVRSVKPRPTLSELALKYGVTLGTIHLAAVGKTWSAI